MKKFALLSSFLLLAGVASAAPAKSTHHTSKSKDSAKATTAAAKTVAPADIMGEVVSVDAAKKTVSFKNEKGENVTWPVEGAAIDSLKTLKAGEKVVISYAVDATGAPKAITSIKAAPAAK
jgi:hypothetical protein